jgi:hypothetical protein
MPQVQSAGTSTREKERTEGKEISAISSHFASLPKAPSLPVLPTKPPSPRIQQIQQQHSAMAHSLHLASHPIMAELPPTPLMPTQPSPSLPQQPSPQLQSSQDSIAKSPSFPSLKIDTTHTKFGTSSSGMLIAMRFFVRVYCVFFFFFFFFFFF